jgi:light-regulated signal transduction histidine kinase (bacteriophytochrome)
MPPTWASSYDDLLDFSRLGRSSLTVSTVDMNDMVQVVVQELKVTTEQSQTDIHIQHLPPVKCDPTLMKQVGPISSPMP